MTRTLLTSNHRMRKNYLSSISKCSNICGKVQGTAWLETITVGEEEEEKEEERRNLRNSAGWTTNKQFCFFKFCVLLATILVKVALSNATESVTSSPPPQNIELDTFGF